MTLVCQICSRPNAAKHFNGISCRSCKEFFRRVIKLKRKYTCLLGSECEISKTAQFYCRACRFRRCLEAEMDPKLVQSDRSVEFRSSSQASPSDASTEITPYGTILPASCGSCSADTDYNENSLCSVFIKSSKHFQMQNMGSLGTRNLLKPFNLADTASVVKYLLNVDNIMNNFYEAELDVHTHAATDLNHPIEVAFLFEPRRLCTRTKIHWQPMYQPKMENFQFIWARGILHYVDGISFYPQLFDLDYHDRLLIAVARCCPVGSMETALKSMKFYGKKGDSVGR
ncbi:Nuclear hormone receptor family member nhr-34 [Aphelenchoides besseyi]|nr:Nuclear hormone receptor family member nhr-34 [Aphelenchoides besseyi]